MTTPLKIDARAEGKETAVLSLAGEVDVANAAQVRDSALKLISSGVKRLVVDLNATEYMDSTGLGMLVGLLKRMRESGGDVLIAVARPRVKRLFEITGLIQVFRIYDDAAAALKEVRG
ncbi:MAG TPA: STAS domain-containing protein [Armatimonadota bacterium]|nr:STAS domain-containing protein [Armatimonadota bacterium]